MISKEEVLHIAKLARLELSEKETGKMQKDLTAILNYFDVLKRAPQTRAELTRTSADKRQNATRKDLVIERPASLANNLIAGAPDKKDDYIKVKSIL